MAGPTGPSITDSAIAHGPSRTTCTSAIDGPANCVRKRRQTPSLRTVVSSFFRVAIPSTFPASRPRCLSIIASRQTECHNPRDNSALTSIGRHGRPKFTRFPEGVGARSTLARGLRLPQYLPRRPLHRDARPGIEPVVERSEDGRQGPLEPGGRERDEHKAGAPTVYWITSSARPSSDGGIVRPRALAVFMLITSSNFVGCSTGRSAGLAPLRILST